MNSEEASLSSLHTSRVKTRQQIKGTQPTIEKLKRKYCHISPERKNHLITLVLDKKLRIKDAAIICNLNYSTAKTILYTLRHKTPKQAQFKPISDLTEIKIKIAVFNNGVQLNEYDYFKMLNSG